MTRGLVVLVLAACLGCAGAPGPAGPPGSGAAVYVRSVLAQGGGYRGGGLTFGAGSAQGLGLFVAAAGDNVYDGPVDAGFGLTAGDLFTDDRATEPAYGLFVGSGGPNV